MINKISDLDFIYVLIFLTGDNILTIKPKHPLTPGNFNLIAKSSCFQNIQIIISNCFLKFKFYIAYFLQSSDNYQLHNHQQIPLFYSSTTHPPNNSISSNKRTKKLTRRRRFRASPYGHSDGKLRAGGVGHHADLEGSFES